jgi:hypothetical protein
MRAMVLREHGGPDVLKLEELYRSITVHYEFMGMRLAAEVDPGHQGAILSSVARLVDRGLLRAHVERSRLRRQLPDGARMV